MGTDINNVACYRLGTMPHLWIQKEKEVIKTLKFQQQIGGTAACMKRLMMATKGCVQLTSNETYFYYLWFSEVKTVEGEMAEGVYYFRPVKTIHKSFYLDTLTHLMRYFPGG